MPARARLAQSLDAGAQCLGFHGGDGQLGLQLVGQGLQALASGPQHVHGVSQCSPQLPGDDRHHANDDHQQGQGEDGEG